MLAKLIAEGLGTFWLVLGGCGSAVLAAAFPDLGIGFTGVSLAFGLTVVTGAYALGPISGGHFNPAVTVGAWAGGRFPAASVVPYIVAQVVGAIAGAAVLYVIARPAKPTGARLWVAPRITTRNIAVMTTSHTRADTSEYLPGECSP